MTRAVALPINLEVYELRDQWEPESNRMTTFAGLNSAQQAFAYTPRREAGVIIPNDKDALEPKSSGRDSHWFALGPQVITQD